METLLWLEELWHLIENGFAEPTSHEAFKDFYKSQQDELKAIGKRYSLALYLIQQSMDDSIFYKISKENTSKKVWDIFKMAYSKRWSNPNLCQDPLQIVEVKHVVLEEIKDDEEVNVLSTIVEVAKDEVEELPSEVKEDDEQFLVVEVTKETKITEDTIFAITRVQDEEIFSIKEWLRIMEEKKLANNLFNGRENMLEIQLILTIVAINDKECVVVVNIVVEIEKVEFDGVYVGFAKPKYDEPCDKIDRVMQPKEHTLVEDVKVLHILVDNVVVWATIEMKINLVLFYYLCVYECAGNYSNISKMKENGHFENMKSRSRYKEPKKILRMKKRVQLKLTRIEKNTEFKVWSHD